MDPFAILGLPARYDLDRTEIERKYRELQRTLHPDMHAQKGADERRENLERAVQVNEAYRMLSDDVRRAEAVLAVRGIEPEENGVADQEFLMEVMELREGLMEARVANNLEQVQGLEAFVINKRDDAVADLLTTLADEDPDEADARDALGRLRYFARFLDEVAAFYDAHDDVVPVTTGPRGQA